MKSGHHSADTTGLYPVPMWVAIDVVNPAGIECTRPADQAVYFISLSQQQLSQIGAILASDSGYYSFFQNEPPNILPIFRIKTENSKFFFNK